MCGFERQKECEAKIAKKSLPHSFGGNNNRGLIAFTSASPRAVVTATELWLVVLVSGVREIYYDSEKREKLPGWCIFVIRLQEWSMFALYFK